MFYIDIIRDLERQGIRYLIIGGVAVNLHGFARATADLDLLIGLESDNISRFVQMMESRGWRPRPPVRLADLADPAHRLSWIQEKGMKAFTLYNPARKIEQVYVLLDCSLDFEAAYQRRETMRAGDLPITICSVADLLVLKEAAGRARDRLDIKALQKILELKRER